MFCQKCGTQIADDSAFCPACGTPVQSAAPVQPAAPVVEQPVAPVVEQPAAAPVAPATFNPNALVGKIKNGAWLNLALACTFFLQFILYFCKLIKVSINIKMFGESYKNSETGTIADIMDSSALTVFGILFILIALAGIAYLIVNGLLNISVPVIDGYKKFLLAPAAVSTIFNFIAIFVALGHAKSQLKEFGELDGVKVGLSFGGVLFLLFTIAALALIGYKCYLIFVKKEEA
ncbi:MAG: zinc ribbon domain-containing protein [Clostridia bacterium]|nr:zinc ribbon domain-containing protein [Clostridia bacterium]